MPARSSFAIAYAIAALSIIAPALSAQRARSAPTSPETQYRAAMEHADQQIAAEVTAHSELMKNLEYLTTRIGPRLTGSPQMQAASAWTLQRFKDYGIDAHLETTQVAHAWYRGDDDAAITAPIKRRIPIRSSAWSKATPGAVTGRVVVLDASTPAEVAAYEGKLDGAIVLQGPSTPLHWVGDSADNSYYATKGAPHGVPSASANGFNARRELGQLLAKEHPAVVLRDSRKPDNLFTMGSAGRFAPSAYPQAMLGHEDYDLIYRLTRMGPVTMTVKLTGTFSAGPEPASITVAQIKGSEHPEEQVIIGGHLDSWDLGQGAVDNGTGTMAVLEAARTLKALGWTPKRTITFILFTGEEQGGVGVRTFLQNHKAEISKMDAVLIDDVGTGRIKRIPIENLWNVLPLMTQAYTPLQEVFDLEPMSADYFGSSDHVSFLRAGVPAYLAVQAPAHYGEAHHSQTDTFDKVLPAQANQGAAVLAAWAWNVAELPAALPHHAAAPARTAARP